MDNELVQPGPGINPSIETGLGFFTESDRAELIKTRAAADTAGTDETTSGLEPEAPTLPDVKPAKKVVNKPAGHEGTLETGSELPPVQTTKAITKPEKKEKATSPFLSPGEAYPSGDMIPIETPENLVEAFKTEGFDVDNGGLKQIFDDYKALKQEREAVKEHEEKVKIFESVFQTMPPDLFELVELAYQGKDYKARLTEIVKNAAIDPHKPIEQQDLGQLLDFFFPGKYDDIRSWEDVKGDALFEPVTELLKIKLDGLKKSSGSPEKLLEMNQQMQEKVATSATTSLIELQKSNPGFKDSDLAPIKEVMKSGVAGVFSMIFNEDGTFKPDAAIKLAKIHYFDQTVEAYRGMYRESQKQLEELVSRGGDQRPATSRSTSGVNTPYDADEIRKTAEELIPTSSRY